MTLQQAAWRKQSDVVDPIWKEYQNRTEYSLALVLNPGRRNSSKRKRHPFRWIALVVVILTIVCLWG